MSSWDGTGSPLEGELEVCRERDKEFSLAVDARDIGRSWGGGSSADVIILGRRQNKLETIPSYIVSSTVFSIAGTETYLPC